MGGKGCMSSALRRAPLMMSLAYSWAFLASSTDHNCWM